MLLSSLSLLFGSFFNKFLNFLLKISDDRVRHHRPGLHGRGLDALLHADVLHPHVVNVLDNAQFNLKNIPVVLLNLVVLVILVLVSYHCVVIKPYWGGRYKTTNAHKFHQTPIGSVTGVSKSKSFWPEFFLVIRQVFISIIKSY